MRKVKKRMTKKVKLIITAVLVPLLLIVGVIGVVTFAKIQETTSLAAFFLATQKQHIVSGKTTVNTGTMGIKTEIVTIEHYLNSEAQIADVKILPGAMLAFFVPEQGHVHITQDRIFVSGNLFQLIESTTSGEALETVAPYYAFPNNYASTFTAETDTNSQAFLLEIPKLFKGIPSFYTLKDDTLTVTLNKDDIMKITEIVLRNAADNPKLVSTLIAEYNLPETLIEKTNKTNIEQTVLEMKQQFEVVEKIDISIIIKNEKDKTIYDATVEIGASGQAIEVKSTLSGTNTPDISREQEPKEYIPLDFKNF